MRDKKAGIDRRAAGPGRSFLPAIIEGGIKIRIVNLLENTPSKQSTACGCEHGLSFYCETQKHKILFDTGASDLFLKNAQTLGIDLTQVDVMVLSHGHYDHGGGLKTFLKINQRARVYMKTSAFGDYYSQHKGDEAPRYIGLDKDLAENEQIVFVSGNLKIDEELFLLGRLEGSHDFPPTNREILMKKDDRFLPDLFAHEQCLVVKEKGKRYLFSGCAHHGILNVLEAFDAECKGQPDVVISGFHFMRKNGIYTDQDIQCIVDTALTLKNTKTKYYTCHCTGEKPYESMKRIMGDQLSYVHSGEEIVMKKRGGKGMKWHRFFAWATVVCFVLTMVTGYKHK